MKASDLKHAIRVFDLHPPEQLYGKLVFGPDGYVSYEGLYAGARRPIGLAPKFPCAVDGTALKAVVSMLKDEDVTVGFTESFMMIKGSSVTRLRLAPAEPWYASGMPQVDLQGHVWIEDAKDMLARVNLMKPFTDSARLQGQPVMTGVSMRTTPAGALVMRATDGRRAMVASVPIKEGPLPEAALVPLLELRAGLMTMESDFVMIVDAGRIWLDDGKTSIRMSLLSGKLPAFSSLPTNTDEMIPVLLQKSEIDRVCKAAAAIDADSTVVLRVRDGDVTLMARGKEMGDVAVPCEGRASRDIEIKLGAVSLQHAVRIAPVVTLYLTSPRHPFLMRFEDIWYWATPVA